ncbi:class I SAM-dependent methyltransferase [Candidatus Saccharibacteria bacterium]|nr:class I SAM-dependent methyltransferase [Candidatus Saccharibacteria bacterium]
MANLTNEEKITINTYNKLAKQWSCGHMTKGFWSQELELFKNLLPNGRILEVGAGGGRDAKSLIKLGYDYLGTDISDKLIAHARKKNPDGKFKQVSLYDLNFSELFDGFWCSAVLLHVPKKRIDEALQAITRNMKLGAIGFITIKQGNGEGIEQKIELDGDGRFFAYWQNEEFKKILSKNKYEILKEGYRPMSERSKWLTYHVRVN